MYSEVSVSNNRSGYSALNCLHCFDQYFAGKRKAVEEKAMRVMYCSQTCTTSFLIIIRLLLFDWRIMQ